MAGLGVYVGNDPKSVAAYENWLGRDVEFVAAHTGQANWSDWKSSISWLAGQFKDVDATLTWSIPMFANGGTLAAAAKGDYDANYVYAAKQLVAASVGDDKIYVRFGEEFNGNWMAWSAAGGKEATFAAAYRDMVTAFRSVSDKFVFEWNVNMGDFGVNPELAYPGDKYVDIIGMDFYYDTTWDNKDPVAAWNYNVSRKYGLQWLENFAAAHGKPTAYSEWGVNSDTAGPYIERAKAWFASHNVVYEQYWESDASFAGELSDGKYPNASAAFKTAFGALAGAAKPPASNSADSSSAASAAAAAAAAAAASTAAAAAAAAAAATSVTSDKTVTLTAKQTSLTLTGSANIDGFGNALNNTLIGNAGANSLNGGVGADTMAGGAGNDTYYIDNVGDVVAEKAGEGIDLALSSISYTLTANVENLMLTGTAAINGYGNDLDNLLTGNAAANRLEGGLGNDTLDGGKGADVMVGGKGDDTYYVDASTDQVIELVGEGNDTVYSAVTHTLAANVENLVLLYSGDSAGAGNDLNNKITGNSGANILKGWGGDDIIDGGAGNDTIDGGTGNDLLHGGDGKDLFVFARYSGNDTINDFKVGEDRLDLSAYVKAGLAPTLTDTGSETLITFKSGDMIHLLGVHASDLHADASGFYA